LLAAGLRPPSDQAANGVVLRERDVSVAVKDERAKRARTSGGGGSSSELSSNPRNGAAEDEAEVTGIESLDARLSRQQREAEASGELVDVTQASRIRACFAR